MSGHSKWSTIKHKKGVADQRRGQIFSKLAKAIVIAAREGFDPESNFKLRLAIEKAKQANMPKENIDRAIKKGSGAASGGKLETVTYEGFGPARVAVIVEVITDNKNRTAAQIKSLFEKSGGRLAGPGAVAYQFEQTGLILVASLNDTEENILKIMDLEVENVEASDGLIEVHTQPGKLDTVSQAIEKLGLEIKEKDLVLQPKTLVKIDDQDKEAKAVAFVAAVAEHEDVQTVFANFDFTD